MSDTQSSISNAEIETKTARNQAFVAMFKPNELVWLIDEHYNPVDITWQVDIVREGEQGAWMRQRYWYDTQSGVIFFRGEKPLSEADLEAARRIGKPFGRSKIYA